MSFVDLISLCQASPYFKKVLSELKENKKYQIICGLWGGAKALFITAIYAACSSSILVVVKNEDEAEKIYEDLLIFLKIIEQFKLEIMLITSLDSNAHLILIEKLSCLSAVSAQAGETNRLIVVTTVDCLTLKVISISEFVKLSQNIIVGENIKREEFINKLVKGGYDRVPLVESTGQFSVRGEIMDIWGSNIKEPLRIEFLGDKVESLRQFDTISQRTTKKLERAHIIPNRENYSTLENPFSEVRDDNKDYWVTYLLPKTLIISDNVDISNVLSEINMEKTQHLSLLPFAAGETISFYTMPMENFHRKIDFLCNKLKQWFKNGYQIVLVCDNEGQKQRLRELIESYLTGDEDKIPLIIVGNLSSGFLASEIKIAIINDEEIFGRYHWRRYLGKRKLKEKLDESVFFEMNMGDYAVHEDYGIGIYEGIKRLKIQNYEQDFLVMSYAEGDKLYVPMDQLGLVQKYIGAEGYKPKLYRLGGVSWNKVKNRVKESVQKMAKELIDLYAVRNAFEGYAFSQDSHLQKEFDSAFIYEETPDQLQVIEEVKKDMQSLKPMDRIICGDVGYGKTEVAMRAAFKAVMDTKQVAILVPTTILAEQHLNTFRERFADYPVVVEMLSRFKTKKQQEKIIDDLQRGLVDIIIGTHRLIQKDVKFKDLGLLIIDEEQRFGVRDKEKLKHLRKLVDVLTLTATPIPRTLHMAISGIRNMSIINDSPEGRLPIATYVMGYNEKVVKDAMVNELGRGGQVFFVHNRVKSINKVADELTKIVPQAKIAVAHGKMHEKDLEKIMSKFVKGDFDVLVTTTIIESGLDIPNVNTLIIKNIEGFGLAQLYQLRGRVGRGRHKAYAYLFHSSDKSESLSDEAIKRLEAIQEFTELGAGFKIAMRDLEIRGAGNILGPQQSGYIMEIGFNLYCKLLSQTVNEIREGKENISINTVINLDIPAFLPVTYINDSHQRVNIYRKMFGISNVEELSDLKKELIDRFGKNPPEVESLLEILDLRIIAQRLSISEISQNHQQIKIEFSQNIDFPVEKFVQLVNIEDYKNKISFKENENFVMVIDKAPQFHRDILRFLKKILQKLIQL